MKTRTLPILLALSACQASQPDLGPKISLRKAWVAVVDSLADAQAEGKRRNVVLGLNPCTVTVVFNIAATGTNNEEVGITAGTPATAPASISVNGSNSSAATRFAGNTVTMVLASPECIKAGAVGGGAKKDDTSDKGGGDKGAAGGGNAQKGGKNVQKTALKKPLPPVPPQPFVGFRDYNVKAPTLMDPATPQPDDDSGK